MTIKEKGYIHWDGELHQKKIPWWPITRFGIKSTFRKKFFKLTFFVSLLPAIFYLIGIYVSERLDDFKFLINEPEQISFLTISPKYFRSYFTNDFILFWIVAIVIFCGAGLISDDFKYNSLQLYFSRPLKKIHYFLGKASVIFFFLSLMTLVPGLLLIIFKLIFSGGFSFFIKYPWLPLSVIGYSVLITVFFTFYTLFLSALSKNRRYVAILIFGIYFFSDILFAIFYGIIKDHHFALFSIKANIQQIGALFFNQRLPHDIPWIYSLLIILWSIEC